MSSGFLPPPNPYGSSGGLFHPLSDRFGGGEEFHPLRLPLSREFRSGVWDRCRRRFRIGDRRSSTFGRESLGDLDLRRSRDLLLRLRRDDVSRDLSRTGLRDDFFLSGVTRRSSLFVRSTTSDFKNCLKSSLYFSTNFVAFSWSSSRKRILLKTPSFA